MNKKIVSEVFPIEVGLVEIGNCPLCAEPIKMEDFRDKLSKKEFEINGMCQKCQDKIFGTSNE